MTIHTRITDLIGNTPLIRLNSVATGVRATIAVTACAPPSRSRSSI